MQGHSVVARAAYLTISADRPRWECVHLLTRQHEIEHAPEPGPNAASLVTGREVTASPLCWAVRSNAASTRPATKDGSMAADAVRKNTMRNPAALFAASVSRQYLKSIWSEKEPKGTT